MKAQKFSAGELIVREGDAAESAFYLASGVVEVFVGASDGEKFVAEQFAGDFFGEMGMILEQPRMASVRAKTDVEVEEYDIESFEEDVINNADRRNVYLPNLFERIRVISSLLRNAIDGEVGSTVCRLEPGGGEVPVPVSEEVLPLRLRSVEPLDGASACLDLTIKRFPFNIGRSSRSKVLVENDYYLDDKRPHQVSRGHCVIERRGASYVVRDRYSSCGTILNGERLGREGAAFVGVLKAGQNQLILGDEGSSFKFELNLG